MATLTSIDPAIGPDDGGTESTATGTGFVGAGAPEVRVGGVRSNSVTVNSDTELVFIVPMSVQVSPAVGGLSEAVELTITGAGFSPGDTFSVDGVTATNITVTSSTTMTGTITTGATAQSVDVVVVRGAESFTLVGGFAYVNSLSLTFWESRFGPDIGTVTVYAVDATGNILSTIWQESGDLGVPDWFERSGTFPDPQQPYRIAFHHVTGPAGEQADYAVDDITIAGGATAGYESSDDSFVSSSGIDTADPVTALANSAALQWTVTSALGRWNRLSSTTQTASTGPDGFGAGGSTLYVYTEASSPNNTGGVNFWLFSPEITP